MTKSIDEQLKDVERKRAEYEQKYRELSYRKALKDYREAKKEVETLTAENEKLSQLKEELTSENHRLLEELDKAKKAGEGYKSVDELLDSLITADQKVWNHVRGRINTIKGQRLQQNQGNQ